MNYTVTLNILEEFLKKTGTVYTQAWVVNFMLDNCGYISSEDLTKRRIIEPACGEGAFLVPIVRRLIDSATKRGVSLNDLGSSIAAYDTCFSSIEICKEKVSNILREFGAEEKDINYLISRWLYCADYLMQDGIDSADYIIGNPPYIRSENIEKQKNATYMSRFETVTSGTDIYIAFYEASLNLLKTSGVLCFICADRWLHNAYGKKLRGLISASYSLELVFKMHDAQAFETKVSAYPAITQIGKGEEQGELICAFSKKGFTAKDLTNFKKWVNRDEETIRTPQFDAIKIKDWTGGESSWPISSALALNVINRIEKDTCLLQDEQKRTVVGIGIATGRDEVFILDDPSLVEKDLLLPLATSKNIGCEKTVDKARWLLNPWGIDGDLINLDDYPLARAYLTQYRSELSSRHTAKKNGDRNWYRTIDKVIPGLADKKKLLIRDFSSRLLPVLDSGKLYPHHNLYWITSEIWDLEVLGCLLMSSIAQSFIEAYGVKMNGGTYRLQAQYLRKIRLPKLDLFDEGPSERMKEAFRTGDQKQIDYLCEMAYSVEGIFDDK